MATGTSPAALYDLSGLSVPASALAGVSGPTGGGVASAGVGPTIEGWFRAVASTVAVAGAGEVRFGPVPQGRMWLLQRYVVSVDPPTGGLASASVYLGQAATPYLEDGTIKGDLDVADGDPPIVVPAGEIIIFQWAAAATGRCTARIQYVQAILG